MVAIVLEYRLMANDLPTNDDDSPTFLQKLTLFRCEYLSCKLNLSFHLIIDVRHILMSAYKVRLLFSFDIEANNL